MEEVFLDYDFNIPLENYVDVYFVAETLGIDITECDELILDTYIASIEDMVIQLMRFNDSDYNDYNKLAAIANATFMLQASFALISENTFFANKDKIFEKIEELKNDENNKSANLISDMFKSKDFDADSKQGQIVMRTSELFNALSGKGYDVQVAFDNGESTNSILLGQQGGQVLITINNTDQPLRAFTSGNFEISDENIKILTDIQNEIETL